MREPIKEFFLSVFEVMVAPYTVVGDSFRADEKPVGLFLRVMPKICRICHQRGPFNFNITGSGLVIQVSNRKPRRHSKG